MRKIILMSKFNSRVFEWTRSENFVERNFHGFCYQTIFSSRVIPEKKVSFLLRRAKSEISKYKQLYSEKNAIYVRSCE